MSSTARISVAPVTPALAEAVRALRTAPGQQAFVGDVVFNLAEAERDPLSDAMAVLADDRVVGFYRLDAAPNTVVGRDLGEPTLGLRGMLIDASLQGRGHGTIALRMCCEDVRLRHPHRRLLVLAVHACNRIAVASYRAAGFRDTGERLPGGPAGPQHLMLLRLQASLAAHSTSPSTSCSNQTTNP